MEQYYSRLLKKYFEGVLSREQENELLAWVKSSPENESIFRTEEDRYLREHMMTESEASSIYSVRKRVKKENFVRSFAGVSALAAAVATIVLGLVTLLPEYSSSQDDRKAETQAEVFTVDAPAGSRMRLKLSDGTSVWLNAGSSLSYNSDFNKDRRDVVLNGEGYFEVARNPEKPFVVHTRDCDFTVLGTCFNIYAFDAEKEVQAALLEGSLRVDAENCSVTLKPDQLASYRNGNILKKNVDSKQYICWMKGRIVYDEISLSMLVNRLSRLYDKEILIGSNHLDSRKLRVSFAEGDSLESIFKSICELLPVRVCALSDGSYRISEI